MFAGAVTSHVWSTLVRGRIGARVNLDPGIRYTIARLANYLLISIGLLAALNTAIGLNHHLDRRRVHSSFFQWALVLVCNTSPPTSPPGSSAFERPSRVGDRITIGEDEGDVQAIDCARRLFTPTIALRLLSLIQSSLARV